MSAVKFDNSKLKCIINQKKSSYAYTCFIRKYVGNFFDELTIRKCRKYIYRKVFIYIIML